MTILSDNIGGIIGGTCGIVLMVLMFVVLPIVSKINENAKYKGERRLDALIETFTCVEDYSRCLKTKQKGVSDYDVRKAVYDHVVKSNLPIKDKLRIFVESKRIAISPEYTNTVTGEKYPLRIHASGDIFSHVALRLSEYMKESISRRDIFNAFMIYFIWYAARRHPYENRWSSSSSSDYLLYYREDDAFDDFQHFVRDGGVNRNAQEIRAAFDYVSSLIPCPALKPDSFDSALDFAFALVNPNDERDFVPAVPKKTKKTSRPISSGRERKTDLYEEQTIGGRVVRFYPGPHEYTVDGKKVKSVTEIVKEWSIDNGFYEYGDIPQAVLNRAAQKGIKLHKEIEVYETEGEFGSSNEFYNYLEVKRLVGFEPLESELIVYVCNEAGEPVCAGRLDFTMMLNGKFGICDIKRTSNYHREEVELQLNLYRLGYEQIFGKKIELLRCLRLREEVKEFNTVSLNISLAKQAIKKYGTD